ncbi:toll/interleukin-1 receptor domain-containing protein [Opitutus sp. GAS368]|jgi:hypothetical protein|uniref:toll/interleukin-1 receptor domain-containing protein n=1 Tax=Opitutus sp. GAS368 TaxID=1882749 RepID=UPI00087DF301|nr:toll/interleukin-1 receptor domain-containing protein [Opitutus sp. GAS368]SDR80489.1 TIR domain-containing protein [Opitutus sp. GAS368]
MPGDAQDPTPPPLPSVFISYASADRAAARLLRDCLTAAGLEVWLDEDELGGGEAWDAKIRNQIRTCTYFMPVISATTEVRREGYFRREWRLAVERTLDFADDVMFLVPVVIDDTRDAGARVPEKFFTVQWLRMPGGQPTPALMDLAKRLARGEAVAIAPAAPLAPPAAEGSRKSRRAAEPPPPFPKFPAFPEPGHRARFIYDLVLWFGHLIHSLWNHLPRLVRVIAAIVIIFNLISWIFKDRQPAVVADKNKSEAAAEVNKALWNVGNPNRPRRAKGTVAGAIESVMGAAAETLQTGRPVALVTFSGAGEKNGDYAEEVFGEVCTQLQKDGKPQWGLSPLPLKADALDAEVVSRGVRMKSRFVLTGHAGVLLPGTPPAFTARLFDVATNQLVWKETFETAKNEPEAVAQRIAAEVIKRLEPPAPTPPPTPNT